MSGANRSWLPFTLRMYFYARSEQIKMVFSFVYDGNQIVTSFIRSGLLSVPMREVYNRHIAFSCGNGGVWSEPVQPLTEGVTCATTCRSSALTKQKPEKRKQFAGVNMQVADGRQTYT